MLGIHSTLGNGCADSNVAVGVVVTRNGDCYFDDRASQSVDASRVSVNDTELALEDTPRFVAK